MFFLLGVPMFNNWHSNCSRSKTSFLTMSKNCRKYEYFQSRKKYLNVFTKFWPEYKKPDNFGLSVLSTIFKTIMLFYIWGYVNFYHSNFQHSILVSGGIFNFLFLLNPLIIAIAIPWVIQNSMKKGLKIPMIVFSIEFLVNEFFPRFSLFAKGHLSLFFYLILVFMFRIEILYNRVFSPNFFSSRSKGLKKFGLLYTSFGFLFYHGIKQLILNCTEFPDQNHYQKSTMVLNHLQVFDYPSEVYSLKIFYYSLQAVKDLIMIGGFLFLIYFVAFEDRFWKKQAGSLENVYASRDEKYHKHKDNIYKPLLLKEISIPLSLEVNSTSVDNNLEPFSPNENINSSVGIFPKKIWSIKRNSIKIPLRGIIWNYPMITKKKNEFYKIKRK